MHPRQHNDLSREERETLMKYARPVIRQEIRRALAGYMDFPDRVMGSLKDDLYSEALYATFKASCCYIANVERGGATFKRYARRWIRGAILARLYPRRRQPESLEYTFNGEARTHEPAAPEIVQDDGEVDRILALLAPAQRYAAKRFYIDGLTIKEIAEERGCSIGNISQVLADARYNLRRKLNVEHRPAMLSKAV